MQATPNGLKVRKILPSKTFLMADLIPVFGFTNRAYIIAQGSSVDAMAPGYVE